MNFININTQETSLPNQVGGTYNVTWENSKDLLKSVGWRIKPALPPVESGYERLSVSYIDGENDTAIAIYTDTLIQDRLDREAQEAAAIEEARQNNKALELKQAENNFLLICEQVGGQKVKMGFEDLENALTVLKASNRDLAIDISLMLLSTTCFIKATVKQPTPPTNIINLGSYR